MLIHQNFILKANIRIILFENNDEISNVSIMKLAGCPCTECASIKYVYWKYNVRNTEYAPIKYDYCKENVRKLLVP